VIGGFIGSLKLFGAASFAPLQNFLPTNFYSHAAEAGLGTEWLSTLVALIVALLGIGLAYRMYGRGFVYKENTNPFYKLVFHKYYVDEALNAVLIRPVLALGRGLSRYLEGSMLDGGSRGIGQIFRGASSGLRRVQTGYTRNYALGIAIGVVLIIVYYAVR